MDIFNTNKEINNILIKFTNDELLVLFEWLAEFNKQENVELDDATKKIFYDLECVLEANLSEPFMENYSQIIQDAKKNVLNND